MLEGKGKQVWGQEQRDRDGHRPRFGPFVPPRCWLCLRDPQEGVVEELLLQRGGHRGQVIIIPLLQGTRYVQKPAGTQHPPRHHLYGARTPTLAHASFFFTASFSGSTFKANLRFRTVHSWPQNTFCKGSGKHPASRALLVPDPTLLHPSA